jgi:hypothetical protein
VDVFQTVDLWEKKDIGQVTTTLFALGRTVSIATARTRTSSSYFNAYNEGVLKHFHVK